MILYMEIDYFLKRVVAKRVLFWEIKKRFHIGNAFQENLNLVMFKLNSFNFNPFIIQHTF